MKYEATPIKKTVSKDTAAKYELGRYDTGAIVWHLVKRHKFALVVAYAVVISVQYFLPFIPDLLLSFFR